MLTQTTLHGIFFLLKLKHRQDQKQVVIVDEISRSLGVSTTYTKKIVALLAKKNLVLTKRGVQGGVQLAKDLSEITLLMVVEACQGMVTADYCTEMPANALVCSFHQAMAELHQSTLQILNRWKLTDFYQINPNVEFGPHCKMLQLYQTLTPL
jgi:Rrf2 family protein